MSRIPLALLLTLVSFLVLGAACSKAKDSADLPADVNQALQLANEFIVKAAAYRENEGRYFRVKAGDKARSLPVYNKFDVNTTGVNLTITMSAMYYQNFN